MKPFARSAPLAVWLALAGCAAGNTAVAPEAAHERSAQGGANEVAQGPAWAPGSGAEEALTALWATKPFELEAAQLAKASGGISPRWAETETLLEERSVQYDAQGRSVETSHLVYRILRSSPEHDSVAVGWPSWHEDRPEIKARVISADGRENWLDPKTIIEGSLESDSVHITDGKKLQAALPGVGVGAVVEVQIVHRDRTPAFAAGDSARWSVWQRAPLRRTRLTLIYPDSLPLKIKTFGIGPLHPVDVPGQHQLTLDMAPPKFNPFELEPLEAVRSWPRVEWSTAKSWASIATSYLEWVNEVRKADFDAKDLVKSAGALQTRTEKIQAALNWVRGKARYTALQLGEGALKPTPPPEVLKRGYGDCKDLAVALIATLSKLGIAASPVLIQTEEMQPLPEIPGVGAFDHMIVYVPATKTDAALWIDATAEDYPVGTLPVTLLDKSALIIDPATTALTPTPARAATTARTDELWTITLADFGDAKARFEITGSGSTEGHLRGLFQEADQKQLEEFARKVAPTLFKKAGKLEVQVKNGKPGQGACGLTATTDDVEGMDTGESSAVVGLQNVPIPTWVDDDLIGEDPTEQPSDAAGKKKREENSIEQTGLTPEQLERRPVRLLSQQTVTRTFVIVPPRGFVAATLPKDRTLQMGPSHWSETYRQRPDGSLEAAFRFETGAVDFNAEQLAAFRKSYWDMMREPVIKISFELEPIKKLEDGKPAEAMALFHKLLESSPKDGVLRARYAKILLNLGLGEKARKEIERAGKDAPGNAFVLMVEGAVARADVNGRNYVAPFDRKKAIETLRAAIAAAPDHSWPRLSLAETLERNAQGEEQNARSKELDEAAALYAQLIEEGRSDSARGKLLDILLRTHQYEAVLAWKSKHGESNTDVYGRVADIVLHGSDAVVQELRNNRGNGDAGAKMVIETLGILGALREYKALDALCAAIEPELPNGAGAQLKAAFGGIVPSAVAKNFKTPELASKSLLSQLANAETLSGAAASFAAVASKHGKMELTGLPRSLGGLGGWLTSAPGFGSDVILARGNCVSDGSDAVGFRVRCTVDLGKPLNVYFWWVREGSALKLESLGDPGTLADSAWLAAKAGRAEDAATWLAWWSERVDELQIPLRAALLELFKGSMQDPHSPQWARFVAAQTVLLEDSQKAPAEAIEAFDLGRQQLAGRLRRIADETEANWLANRRDYTRAITILKPLAESEREESMLQRLALILARARRFPEAHALVDAALKRSPNDKEWLSVLASIDGYEGNYTAAIAVLEPLAAKIDDLSVVNNLAWARIMAGQIDDKAEKNSLHILQNENADAAELHSAAVVLVARGKVAMGAELFERLLGRTSSEPWKDSQWQLRAQILQSLGFSADAKEAWSHVTDEDVDFVRLRARALQEMANTP